MRRWLISMALVIACGGDERAAAPPAPAPVAPTPPPVTPDGPDLHTDCDGYRALIDKLAACPKLPAATREGLVTAFRATWATWQTAADQPTISEACNTAAANLRRQAGAVCGW